MMAGICLKRSCKGHLCLRLHLNLHFCSAALNSHNNSINVLMDQLFQAIRQGNLAQIKTLLVANPHWINGQDSRGFTPLIMATYTGNADIARYLLEQGADVNGRDAAGNTPLIGVAFKGDQAMAALLLERGADLQSKNKQGATALSYATEYKHEGLAQFLKEAGA
jgi:ankyrin repeat protein